MTRRPHGTGSVHYDAHRGKWVGTYEAGWTTRGTRRRRKVYATTERGARTKLAAALREEAGDVSETGHRPTVKRWADEWLEITASARRPTTWATNRSCVNLWIVPTIGHKRLDRLTPGDVRAVRTAILAAGRAPSTAIRAHSVLEKMLKDAVREGKRVPEAALMVEGIEAGESDRDIIPLGHARTLLLAARDTPDESRWVAAFLQGLRPAEARGLTWDAVDFDAGRIDVSWQLRGMPYKVAHDRSSGFRIPVGYEARQVRGALHLVRPKTKKGRRVATLTRWMEAALLDWRTRAPEVAGGLVWPDKDGNPRTDAADQEAWQALCDAAGVRHPSGRRYALYECRHTTATLLRLGGEDDATITEIMGHASILSTRAYLHTNQDRTRQAGERLAATLGLELPQIEA